MGGASWGWAHLAIEERLSTAGLAIHSWWSFDVPKTFADARQLYRWLSFGRIIGEVPQYADVQADLEPSSNDRLKWRTRCTPPALPLAVRGSRPATLKDPTGHFG